MPQAPTIASASAVTRYRMTVVLRSASDRSILARVPVGSADLLDAHSEAWWRGDLRRGRPDVPLQASVAVMRPLFGAEGPPWCIGFTLAAGPGPEDGAVCTFGVPSLEPVASRAAAELLSTGVLAAGDRYTYELRADEAPGELRAEAARAVGPRDAPAPVGAPAGVRLAGAARDELTFRRLSLPSLLASARPIGPAPRPDQHAILLLATARRRAERVARKGAARRPVVETGGVLLGTLVSCPETGEMSVVVTDVLEATEAEGERFSLTFSGATWNRIQTVLAARARHPATATDRLVGSVHGHPFKLGGDAAPCAECPEREICSRTSAFFSSDDELWSRAVFAGQPWQIGLVYGVDALDRPDEALHALHDGTLVRRGFHELPDDAWAAALTAETP